jgi:hypothetical protein
MRAFAGSNKRGRCSVHSFEMRSTDRRPSRQRKEEGLPRWPVWAALLLLLTPFTLGIEITEGSFEGRAQFIIKTENATWYYDRKGGGFSRLLDREGRDWIAFSKEPLSEFPASAAAGYRGLPNAVFIGPDKGTGHPGFDQCESELDGPNVIRTRSLSGKWRWTWTFTETTATFHMIEADLEQAWWFLYEGPVAGRFAPELQYWGTSAGGPNRDIPGLRNQQFGEWRWAYFGDTAVERIFFLIHHESDEVTDTFWYLGSSQGGAAAAPDGMVVFGFGRGPGAQPLFRGAGQQFTAGFLEMGVATAEDHELAGRRIEQSAP